MIVSKSAAVVIEWMCDFSERDEFERVLSELQKQHSLQDSTYQAVTREREQLSAEVSWPCFPLLYEHFCSLQALTALW